MKAWAKQNVVVSLTEMSVFNRNSVMCRPNANTYKHNYLHPYNLLKYLSKELEKQEFQLTKFAFAYKIPSF
jgi:hypothetical protein